MNQTVVIGLVSSRHGNTKPTPCMLLVRPGRLIAWRHVGTWEKQKPEAARKAPVEGRADGGDVAGWCHGVARRFVASRPVVLRLRCRACVCQGPGGRGGAPAMGQGFFMPPGRGCSLEDSVGPR